MQIPHSRGGTAAAALKVALILLAAAAACLLWGGVILDLIRIFFGGAIIAFLLTPLARLLEKKLRRPLAALAALLLVGAALAGLIAFLLPALIRQMSGLAELIPDAFARLRALAEALAERLRRRIPDLELPGLNFAGAEQGFGSMAKGAVGYLSGLGGGLYRFSLMVVLSYFLMADRDSILLRLELLAPASRRCLFVRTGNALTRELRLYLRGQATIALAVGVLAGLGLSVVGVPSAPLLGVFVGLFNVIPYFGPFIGGIPAVIMALSVSWQKAAFTVLALFLVQQIDGMVISPRVMGNITGFSPAVVLLALFAGARLGNIAGMLLALPALMTVRTLYRVFVQRSEKN